MDISNFCSIRRGERRKEYMAPWNYNGLTMATDSRILIAIQEQPGHPSGAGYSIARPAYKLLQDGVSIPYEKLPIELKPSGSQCSMCFGHGRLDIEDCSECGGEGFMVFSSYRHTYICDCKECDVVGEHRSPTKNGKYMCPECCGLGYTNTPKKVFNGYYAYHYLVKISKLPGLLVGAMATQKDRLYFKAGNGVRGVLMAIYR